jgi:perosamine synthetase
MSKSLTKQLGGFLPVIKPIYARKCIDISLKDILKFLWNFILHPQPAEETEAELDTAWSTKQTLASYTVRSGFDLCLQACDFPPGSEILVSAVTIPDMVRVIKYHQLVAVPIDIQDDASVSVEDITSLISPKTKAILIAHLFGNRMAFDEIAAAAKAHGIMVFEDCAEAFYGRGFTGSSRSDVSIFSFGLIKTATALGGALLTVQDPSLLASVKAIQAQYPQQKTTTLLRRVVKYSVFKALADSPFAYGVLLAEFRVMGKNHRAVIRKLSRSFLPENFIAQIRQRSSDPLLQLLQYRITMFNTSRLKDRTLKVEIFGSQLPESCRPVGFGQALNTYWLCPIRVNNPGALIDSLYQARFDATDGATSLAVISTKRHAMPMRAIAMMEELVFVSIDHTYDPVALKCLVDVIRHHHETWGINSAIL